MKKKIASALAIATAALALSSAALSQPRPADRKEPPAAAAPEIPSQDKTMIALATECGKRVSSIMEGWISKNEVTEDKLFSYLYYPIPDTYPPKFNTDYDKLADRDLAELQESYLGKSQAITYVVTVDVNGYLPTHNRKYSQPLTGNPAVDLVNNRTKTIFSDRTGLAASRNTKPFLLQEYERDTGEKMVDVSVPIVVRGKNWGALRIGYRRVEAP